MASEDPLDRAISDAAPRAPRGFGAAVEARLGKAERARGQRLAVVGALVTLAAAALVLLLVRPSPPGRPSPSARPSPAARAAEAPPSEWRVLAARAASVLGSDGSRTPLAAGQTTLRAGDRLEVDPAGEATLEGRAAMVRLTATRRRASEPPTEPALLRVGEHELSLERGQARLAGPEAHIAVNGTTVTALGPGAAVVVQARRSEMTPIMSTSLNRPILAAAATLAAVFVHSGAARVQPAGGHAPLMLAAKDRALVADKLPPLVTRKAYRAPGFTSSDPLDPNGSISVLGSPDDPLARTVAPNEDRDGRELSPPMRSAIREIMHGRLAELRACYEAGLDKNVALRGRLVVRLRIEERSGKGVVADAEAVPSGVGDLHDPVTEQCILEAIARAQFPAPSAGGPTTIVYPFLFANDSPPATPKPDDGVKLLYPRF